MMRKIALTFAFSLLSAVACIYGQDNLGVLGGMPANKKMSMPVMKREALARENALIYIVKNKDMDQFKDYLADDFVGVYDMGITGKDEDVQTVQQQDLKSITTSDQKVTFPSDDLAIVTYKAKVEGSYKGQDFTGTYNVFTTWAKRNGKWNVVEHSEVKSHQ